jgi:hypothetical protein
VSKWTFYSLIEVLCRNDTLTSSSKIDVWFSNSFPFNGLPLTFPGGYYGIPIALPRLGFVVEIRALQRFPRKNLKLLPDIAIGDIDYYETSKTF